MLKSPKLHPIWFRNLDYFDCFSMQLNWYHYSTKIGFLLKAISDMFQIQVKMNFYTRYLCIIFPTLSYSMVNYFNRLFFFQTVLLWLKKVFLTHFDKKKRSTFLYYLNNLFKRMCEFLRMMPITFWLFYTFWLTKKTFFKDLLFYDIYSPRRE